MLNYLNSFAKFHPYNLAITINIGDGFFSDIEIDSEEQATEYMKLFFDQIQTNQISKKAIDFLTTNFSGDSKHKNLLHYSSIVHESKHFHDYVLSPVGNYMIRRYFYLYAYLFPLLIELSRESNTLLTPIHYMEKLTPNNFSDAFKNFTKFKNSSIDTSIKFLNSIPILDKSDDRSKNYKISGNDIFEASAVLSQFSQIEHYFGFENAIEFQLFLKEHIPNYTNTLETLQLLLAQYTKKEGYVIQDNELLNTILFSSLCGNFNNGYKINAQNPSERFAILLGALLDSNHQINANNIFEYSESLAEEHGFISIRKSLEDNLELNQKHYSLIEKIVSNNFDIENPWSQELLTAYKFFIEYNKKMTKLFLDDPSSYLKPLNYATEFLPKMPVPIILEEHSGLKIPFLINHDILNKENVHYITYDNIHDNEYFYKYWAVLFKNKSERLNPISIVSLYNKFTPLFFLLTEGERANYNFANPRNIDLINDSIRNIMKVDIKDAFPISSEFKSKKMMQDYSKLRKLNGYKCDICRNKINNTEGFLLDGNSLYKNKTYNYILQKTSQNYNMEKLIYKNDYSFYALCTKCYELLFNKTLQ
ncbi:MAG: hypothetical protein ACQESP_12705 [Candidatus Muiribacteriota bacterium]